MNLNFLFMNVNKTTIYLSLIICFTLIFYSCSIAQVISKDTLYVLYNRQIDGKVLDRGKHHNDPNPDDFYPFDGGHHYYVHKTVHAFQHYISFSYWDYIFEGSSTPFHYKIVNKTFIEEKDFKDKEWFDSTDYYDILKYFRYGRDVEIYLVDKDEIKDPDKIYMVRVYLGHTTEE